MGYTHYWDVKEALFDIKVAKAVTKMKKIAAARRDLVEVSQHGRDIWINGKGEDAYEDFVWPGEQGFNFCKTARKPYDEVVTACLLVAAADFPQKFQFDVSSDGDWDEWGPGRALYREVIGKNPPKILKTRAERAKERQANGLGASFGSR